jgi:metalloprotease
MKRVFRLLLSRNIVFTLIFCLWTVESGVPAADGITKLRDAPVSGRATSSVTRSQVERLRRIMLPLVRGTDNARADQLRFRIVDDPNINAGSAGNGEFIVTTGLLNKATDDQLRGVLAHELAHDQLGHANRLQVLVTGLGLGVGLLEQLIPGSSAITPIAGTLLAHNYSRPQEFEADRHAVKILRLSGYSKDVMIDTLSWLKQTNGDTGGGILSTHPAISDRIRALQALR